MTYSSHEGSLGLPHTDYGWCLGGACDSIATPWDGPRQRGYTRMCVRQQTSGWALYMSSNSEIKALKNLRLHLEGLRAKALFLSLLSASDCEWSAGA